MAASPEEKQQERFISTGTAARILNKSRSSIYRYVESGDLNPTNTLPPRLARQSRKKRSLAFRRDEVLQLARKLSAN